MEYKPLCTSEIAFKNRDEFYGWAMDLPVHNVVLVMDESLAGFLNLNEFTMDLQIRFAVRWIKRFPAIPHRRILTRHSPHWKDLTRN